MNTQLIPNIPPQGEKQVDIDLLLINHGIEILNKARESKETFLRSLLQINNASNCFDSLEVDHYGLLLLSRDIIKIEKILKDSNFSIKKKFPSQVVSKKLSKHFGVEISDLEIVIIKAKNKVGSQLELFVCTSGLSREQLLGVMIEEIHIALELKRVEQANSLLGCFKDIGFYLEGGGINDIENVTILYISNRKEGASLKRVELIISGVFPRLVEKVL